MKHLKTYKLFESIDNNIKSDIEDILLDINDEMYWKAKCWSEEYGWIVIIEIVDEDPEYELEGQTPPSVIVETIERLIDYMAQNDFDKYHITYEEDDNDEIAEVSVEEVSNLDIWSNQFIRVEFWNEKLYK